MKSISEWVPLKGEEVGGLLLGFLFIVDKGYCRCINSLAIPTCPHAGQEKALRQGHEAHRGTLPSTSPEKARAQETWQGSDNVCENQLKKLWV